MNKLLKKLLILKRLLEKDIIFNIKGFSIGVLFSIIAYIFIAYDTDQNVSIAIYMSFMVTFSNYIGKSCLIEERDLVYDYLKILPLKKSYIVLSKYIGSLFVIIISCATLLIANILLFFMKVSKLNLSIDLLILMIAIYILYFSLYLAIFFKYNYSTAQNTILILFIGMILIFKYFKNVTYINLNIQYILLIVSFVALYISYKISQSQFINKKNLRINRKKILNSSVNN